MKEASRNSIHISTYEQRVPLVEIWISKASDHVPVVDRTPLEPPPVLIAVTGPPKVGKSTLIAGLVKNFTRQNLSDHKGPVTVVSGKIACLCTMYGQILLLCLGKKRRLTFIECGNDVNTMIDVAKTADLV